MSVLTIEHGPPERLAIHVWNTVIALNDLDAWPRYEITGPIQGFRGRPPVDEAADDNIGRIGATPRPGVARPRDITYQLTVIGRTLPELMLGQSRLGAAFADGETPGLMGITPAGTYTGQQWLYSGKPQALTPGAESFDLRQSPGAYQQAYTLTIRAYDPRYYAGADNGLARVNIALPAGVATAAANLGNAPTDPEFRIAGPLSDAGVALANQTINKTLQLQNVDVASGDALLINFAARSITLESTGENLRRLYRPLSSTWWRRGVPGLNPGANHVRITGAAGSVRYHHAHWG